MLSWYVGARMGTAGLRWVPQDFSCLEHATAIGLLALISSSFPGPLKGHSLRGTDGEATMQVCEEEW